MTSPTTSWVPCHRLGRCCAQVYVDPEVLGHDTVTFAAGTQTESVKMQTQELFGTGGFTTVSLVKQPEQGSDDRIW